MALKCILLKVMTSQGYPWLKTNLTESDDVAISDVALKVNPTNSNNITRLKRDLTESNDVTQELIILKSFSDC
jgi:hypothetical protein